MKKVLIIGSGKTAPQYFDYPYKDNDWHVVVVNNAFRLFPDWDNFVCSLRPKQYTLLPEHNANAKVTDLDCHPYMKQYCGSVAAAGYSIMLAASYWTLGKLRPDIIGYLGGDMNYTPDPETGNTAFYGIGDDLRSRKISDPDLMVRVHGNDDPKYLERVYMQFYNHAEKQGCEVFNFSVIDETRLPYPKNSPEKLDDFRRYI